MKLATEFVRLPFQFDAARLKAETDALPLDAWRPHPTGFKGNTAVPLISVDGEINDYFAGPMQGTRWLSHMPYVRQVLASFGVVFGRSRLMGLDGGAEVTAHCDANYHWFTRARIHIPVVTYPEVEFHCGEKKVHMAAGEAWLFDNWRIHRVLNGSPNKRIHLVADTLGSSFFWSVVEQSIAAEVAGRDLVPKLISFDPGIDPPVLGERYNTPLVMAPSEMKELTEDLISDLDGSVVEADRQEAGQFAALVRGFYQDWAMLWALHADEESAWDKYEKLRNRVMQQLQGLKRPLLVGSTGLPAQKIFLARVLVACLRRPLPAMKTLQFAH